MATQRSHLPRHRGKNTHKCVCAHINTHIYSNTPGYQMHPRQCSSPPIDAELWPSNEHTFLGLFNYLGNSPAPMSPLGVWCFSIFIKKNKQTPSESLYILDLSRTKERKVYFDVQACMESCSLPRQVEFLWVLGDKTVRADGKQTC